MNEHTVMRAIERRIGLFIAHRRKTLYLQTKNDLWSQASFIHANQACQFYDVALGEAVCSRATLIQIEKGRKIKDIQLYVFFLCKLGIEIRWLELKMYSDELKQRKIYESLLLDPQFFNKTQYVCYESKVLSFLYQIDEDCVQFCYQLRYQNIMMTQREWYLWFSRLPMIHPDLQFVLSEYLSVELYLRQDLSAYVYAYLKVIHEHKQLMNHNRWLTKAYSYHAFNLPHLQFIHPFKKEQLIRQAKFRWVNQAHLDLIIKKKRFEDDRKHPEPYPYIHSQISMVLNHFKEHPRFDMNQIIMRNQ